MIEIDLGNADHEVLSRSHFIFFAYESYHIIIPCSIAGVEAVVHRSSSE